MNCKKHNRLIVFTDNIDTREEKSYCGECIRQLEDKIMLNVDEIIELLYY